MDALYDVLQVVKRKWRTEVKADFVLLNFSTTPAIAQLHSTVGDEQQALLCICKECDASRGLQC